MKTKLLLATLLLFSTSAFAQEFNCAILGGINYSQTPSGKSNMSNNGEVIGFQVGANAYYELKSHWTFISGLSFIQKGGDQKITSKYFSQSESIKTSSRYGAIHYRINYLTLPLKVGYKFRIGDNFSLLPQAGIGLAYGFNAGKAEFDIKGKGVHKWKPFDGYSNPEEMIKIKKFNHLDVTANIGLEARIKKHYMLSLSYDHGLRKMQDDFDTKSSTIQLSVGYIF